MQILFAVYCVIFLLAFVFIKNQKKLIQQNFLKLILTLVVYIAIIKIFEESGLINANSVLYFSAGIPISLFIPLSFLFVRNCYENTQLKKKDWVHAIPFFVSLFLFGYYYFADNKTYSTGYLLIYGLFGYIVTFVYLALLFLAFLSSSVLGVFLKEKVTLIPEDLVMAEEPMQHSGNDNKEEEQAPENSQQRSFEFTDEQAYQMNAIIKEVMTSRQPFLHKKYSIVELAGQTNIHLHQLSAFINSYYKMHFNDFINQYRIEYCKNKIIVDEEWRYLTLEAIAEESGFGNRNTFTSAFKKFNGVTPTEFLKQVKNKKQVAA